MLSGVVWRRRFDEFVGRRDDRAGGVYHLRLQRRRFLG